MLHIGITGQTGFIGTNLHNFFRLKKEGVECIPFEDHYFEDHLRLEDFTRKCDVIIHLAALNRHNDPQTIYDTNILLLNKLIKALDNTGSKPHILFSSSTQEERDNMFGKSKREGRRLLASWAEKNNTPFTGLVIPNVFGPFGNPYYNSVIATFSHQLTHYENPKVEIDAQLNLIYIGELADIIYELICNKTSDPEFKVPHTDEIRVSEILELLKGYKSDYYEKGIIPDISTPFKRNLFNTFVCYIDIPSHFPVKLNLNTDERGSFVETMRVNNGGQTSFSTTRPGVTRGNHFHTRKAERFAVIRGKAKIQLRRIGTDQILNFELDGKEPSYVDMPVWYTHNITNTGDEDLYTIFWINEFFNPEDPDTYFEKV